MNSYNLAVTIGPNIFRPKVIRPEDISSVGIYYELIIRMMENFEILFDRDITAEEMAQEPVKYNQAAGTTVGRYLNSDKI